MYIYIVSTNWQVVKDSNQKIKTKRSPSLRVISPMMTERPQYLYTNISFKDTSMKQAKIDDKPLI